MQDALRKKTGTICIFIQLMAQFFSLNIKVNKYLEFYKSNTYKYRDAQTIIRINYYLLF